MAWLATFFEKAFVKPPNLRMSFGRPPARLGRQLRYFSSPLRRQSRCSRLAALETALSPELRSPRLHGRVIVLRHAGRQVHDPFAELVGIERALGTHQGGTR
jgi:hypothetical protein